MAKQTLSINTTANNYRPGGTISVNTTPVGNTTTGEDNLMTYTIAADSLALDKDRIEFEASGIFAAAVSTKQIRGYLGATLIFDTGALAITAASSWVVRGTIIRTDTSEQSFHTEYNGSDAALLSTALADTGTEDFTTSLVLKLTGEGVNTNDIVQQTMVVSFYPAI